MYPPIMSSCGYILLINCGLIAVFAMDVDTRFGRSRICMSRQSMGCSRYSYSLILKSKKALLLIAIISLEPRRLFFLDMSKFISTGTIPGGS